MPEKDSVQVQLGVKEALGRETLFVKLSGKLKGKEKEVTDRISRDVRMVLFPRPKPWSGDTIELSVPDGSYALARAKVSLILTDILSRD